MKSKLNKDIASQFNESPCDILKSSSDRDAYYISTSFIPTLRIKQWKPVDQSKVANSSMAYCYLEQDDPVVNYNCTKDTFGAKPFVSRVFQDNQQEITRPIATDKCVIEIDPSKIEPGALNDFWHKMETNQCKNMVDKYADSNNALEGDISRLTDELIPLNKTYNANVATISTRRGTLGGLRTDIYELDREIRELKTASNDQAEMRTIYRQTLADKTASCSSTAAQLLEYNNTCTVNLTYWTGQYNTASTTYATKKPVYEKQQVKYNTNKMALSNIMQQYTNLVENKKQLDINYVVENNNNIKCQDDKARCFAAYETCSREDAASITQGKKNNQDWQSCLGTLAICNTDSKSCKADLEQLDKKNTDAVLSYQKCQNALEACDDELKKDNMTRDGITRELNTWKATHVNCSKYPPIISGLRTAIQDILAWCKFPMEVALQNQQAYNEAVALGVQSTATQVAACEAGQDTLPATIPAVEMANTMPERGEGPPDFTPPEKLTKARLYTEINFGGKRSDLGLGRYEKDAMGIPNDSLKSIELPIGWKAVIMQNEFWGAHYIANNSMKDLTKDAGWGVTSISLEPL